MGARQKMTFGDVTVSFSGYTASGPEGKIDITPKEIDLLRLLVEHKGLVLTRSQILDELWGDDYAEIVWIGLTIPLAKRKEHNAEISREQVNEIGKALATAFVTKVSSQALCQPPINH